MSIYYFMKKCIVMESIVIFFLLQVRMLNDVLARPNPRRILVNENRAAQKIFSQNSAGSGTLVYGKVVTDIKKVLESKYKYFTKCMISEQHCGEMYNDCYDTTNANMKSNLEFAKTKCFNDYFSNEGNIEQVKKHVFSVLDSDMVKLCTDDNNRQKIPGGCTAMVVNQSPGYMRYRECVKSACVSMDGGIGDFSGCFGDKQIDALNQAIGSCAKMLSTYSLDLSKNIRKELFKEVRTLEKRSCDKMSGNYKAGSNIEDAGTCTVFVGYSRERSMSKKYSIGSMFSQKEFYAITESGDFYEKGPSSFPTFPQNVSETSEKFFGRFEDAKPYKIGSDVFCSHSTFNLPRLFKYDSTYDSKYGSGINGTAPGGMAGGDMALMTSAIGVAPAIMGLFSKKEGTEKLSEQVSGIEQSKEILKKATPSIVGMATVGTNKGKNMRIGEEIKGSCTVQGGSSYNEGDTISIRWQ